ncbi:hypothetical protein ABD87_00050 [Lysinibacillus sphaericus]|uniref:hypothetical protein n=1 Tax=Lysinibacillus sphaericus TaxID=1421 RepID=UPI0018CCE46B|nr:hypothetical protein [Lysinibacillus sphaericus]MBG9727984.1 hypothetical protein [Lysinibacillus sphaericus]
MTILQLGFKKIYVDEQGNDVEIIFEAVTLQATITLKAMINGEQYLLKECEDNTSSSFEITFELPFAVNVLDMDTVFSSKILYSELLKWQRTIETLKKFKVQPINLEPVRLVTYGSEDGMDLEYEVSQYWLKTWLRMQKSDLADLNYDVFLNTYNWDHSIAIYEAAKASNRVLTEEYV